MLPKKNKRSDVLTLINRVHIAALFVFCKVNFTFQI